MAGELNDPLAKIGFLHINAGLLEILVEMNLLSGHGLRLDDALDTAPLCEAENVVLHRLGIAGAENFGATGLGGARNCSASSSKCEEAEDLIAAIWLRTSSKSMPSYAFARPAR